MVLLGITLEAAKLAGEESDGRILEGERRRILARLADWSNRNRIKFESRYPQYRGMAACDCLEVVSRHGKVDPAVAGALHAWSYAERMLVSFSVLTASCPFPGVRLALMYRDATRVWPAVA